MNQGFANTTRESILNGWSLIVEPGILVLKLTKVLFTTGRFHSHAPVVKYNYLALAGVR